MQNSFSPLKLCILLIMLASQTFGQLAEFETLKSLFQGSDSIKNELSEIEQLTKSLPDSVFQALHSDFQQYMLSLNEEQDKRQYAIYFYFLSYWYYLQEEDVDAIKYSLSGMEFIKGFDEKFLEYRFNYLIASSYSRIAYITRSINLYGKGLNYHLRSLKALEATKSNQSELSTLYALVGHAYHGVRKIDSSEYFYIKAGELAKENNDEHSFASSLLNRGNLFFRYGQLYKADSITDEALRYANTINDTVIKIYSLLNLSLIHKDMGEPDVAFEYANRTYFEAQKIGFSHMMYRADQERAHLCMDGNKYDEAAVYLKKCVAHLIEKKDYYKLKITYRALSDLYTNKHNFVKANFYQDKYIRINDSLTLDDFNKKISLVESLYEHETLNFENKLLDKENKLKKAELGKSKLFILLAIVIVILLVVLITYERRLKNVYFKQNKIIKSQSKEIIQKNNVLNNYKENLESLVEERTEALWDALRQTEESNNLKNAFLRNLSHEIRTPLNAIIGFSRLININDKVDIPKKLKLIDENGEDLLNTVEKIIEVSKLETEEQVLYISCMDANVFNESLLSSLEKTVQKNKQMAVVFKPKLSEFSGNVSTDIEKLQRVIFHLVDNALKYTEFGQVYIKSLVNEEILELQVGDSGCGIAHENIETVFNSFHKIESLRQLTSGIGVGLTIVDRFVKVLKGEISVTSELNKSTVFTIRIPRHLSK